MISSSIHLQITFCLLIFSPLAFSRIRLTNQTLIFPLTTQNIHNTSSTTLLQRRRISSSPSVKIPFTHDVTLTVSLTAGSPPQTIKMVLDTGSELTWLYCKQSSTPTPIFDHAKSSSYIALPCSSPVCTIQTQDLPAPATCDKHANLCHVAVSYVDGSSLDGNLAQETFGIGFLTRPATAFGCMDSSSSATPEDNAETSTGLMGMNRGRLSFINQMGLSKFSYCISGSDSTGVLVLGAASLPPLKYSPLVTKTDRLPYWDRFAYTVQFEGIQVGSKLLPIPKSAFVPDHTGAGQTILDSGTQFTFLLDPVYNALKTEFIEQTKSVLTVDPSYVFQTALDLCFQVGSTKPDFFKIANGSGSHQKYCFTFGNSGLAGFEMFIIGNVHQQDVWMEYDLANAQVGFANDVKCDQPSQLLESRL
ncbi:unnamed protein product [Eruca vesicaria subsp. sativa]|uniref:Peptidase A1 domain-containing protein n=1 Tax=Eruca vesicaria subsp. sativa TaxID=29727 RepID=A0ABC8K779_ERUVS|nr:unnamed protein product [Eruca vesicaria subsp. sativa]